MALAGKWSTDLKLTVLVDVAIAVIVLGCAAAANLLPANSHKAAGTLNYWVCIGARTVTSMSEAEATLTTTEQRERYFQPRLVTGVSALASAQ